MKLAESYKTSFPPEVRRRGEAYVQQGRVEIDVFKEDSIHGSCEGAETYFLSVLKEENGLCLSCDCQYFSQHGACKHLYALLQIVDALPETATKRLFLQGIDQFEGITFDVPGHEEDGEAFTPTASNAGIKNLLSRLEAIESAPRGTGAASERNWEVAFRRLRSRQHVPPPYTGESEHQIHYLIDSELPTSSGELRLRLCLRRRLKSGEWSKPRRLKPEQKQATYLADEADREIMTFLKSAEPVSPIGYAAFDTSDCWVIPPTMDAVLLPRLCATRRLYLWDERKEEPASELSWEPEQRWELYLALSEHSPDQPFRFHAAFRSGGAERPVSDAVALLSSGHVIFQEAISHVNHHGLLSALDVFDSSQPLEIARKDANAFVQQMMSLKRLPPVDLPESMAIEVTQGTPQPVLHTVSEAGEGHTTMFADIRVAYGTVEIDPVEEFCAVLSVDGRRIMLRDHAYEARLENELRRSGFNVPPFAVYHPDHRYSVAIRTFPRCAETLLANGWRVMAHGKPYRRVGEMSCRISSGVDWFDLQAECVFDEIRVGLPEILKAVRAGESVVLLGDGSVGMLPEEWLIRHRYLLDTASVVEDKLRFKATQAMLLDTMLQEQSEMRCDEKFAQVREKLSHFEKVEAATPSETFKGTLRPYQAEGLGWLLFLQEFGLGGCLADDMGLGKTIQVLALLSHRRVAADAQPLPTLIVVPRSLVFNWEREAAHFTPHLKVLRNTGPNRETSGREFSKYDIILTTYGTVRSDAAELKDLAFDYVILDEAQAIKNASTATAKAVRLLPGRHRLALSGTPIENHIGELWSLFEFLNPGMLGSSRVFDRSVAADGNIEQGARALIAQAVRPFVLRRTKSQVAKDLPDKLEETIFCELLPEQRVMYDQLRDHYRQSLLGSDDTFPVGRNKIQVLEALLRLRQVACHPGLVDKSRLADHSAKLDTFIEMVAEVVASGRKVLAFSQFTSLLAIVRDRLEKQNIVYEYLDGKTRNRQQKVDRFQEDDACPVFLISLKAGGYGLNLTKAEYVFLLDPWWNPAVESQAIDRAHRIGQTQKVFAYRFIAKDTVEEKVLELQETKRSLADAIIGADNSLIKNLERKDLELLLS